MRVRSARSTTAFLCVEAGANFFTKTGLFAEKCCETGGGMLLLLSFIVKLLFFKGLGTELPGIEREKADSQIRFRNHPRHPD
jgi:hypothetical protein